VSRWWLADPVTLWSVRTVVLLSAASLSAGIALAGVWAVQSIITTLSDMH
jgi:hypothetical protein